MGKRGGRPDARSLAAGETRRPHGVGIEADGRMLDRRPHGVKPQWFVLTFVIGLFIRFFLGVHACKADANAPPDPVWEVQSWEQAEAQCLKDHNARSCSWANDRATDLRTLGYKLDSGSCCGDFWVKVRP